jgi:hypothetical protein
MTTEVLLARMLLYAVLPLWLAAGLADYFCHRRTRIEATSGTGETRLHIIQLVQICLPVLAGLFLQINLAVALHMALALIAHMVTAYADTTYADTRRLISPFEQHVHAYLDLLPLFALALVVAIHWPGIAGGDLQLRWRENPLPAKYALPVLVALAVAALAVLEEHVRVRGWDAPAEQARHARSEVM